ncbi:major tail protein [Weissella phage PWc]|nr:major tail protein [Weissella phage PWc]
MADEKELLTPSEGVKKIIMVRKLADEAKEDAKRLSLQTTHSITSESKANETTTKDGVINVFDQTTTSMDLEFIGSDDPLYDILKDASYDKEKLELWEIDFNLATTDKKYKAYYMRGTVSSFEEDNDADGFSTTKVEFTVDGKPQRGTVELENDVVSDIQYAFRDTKKVAPEAKTASK